MRGRELFRERVVELVARALNEADAYHTDRPATGLPTPAPGIWDLDSFSLLQLLVTLEDEFRVSILAVVDEFDGDSVDDFVDFVAARADLGEAEMGRVASPRVSIPRGEADPLRGRP